MTNEKNEERSTPYVRIIEQPTSKGIRFRYECEGRFAGSLAGENATIFRKTYPTIKIENYNGPAFIVVSCVSKDPPFYPHPHNLVGKAREVSNGICYFKTEDMVVSFAHLGIQCVTRKGIKSSLEVRKKLQVDPFRTGFDQNPEGIDLYCVRLCFQVFLEGDVKENFNIPLEPIVSDQIHDKRLRVEPVINFISHNSAPAAGGTEICILCEKAMKDDIEVRFFRKENNWEAIAEFTPPNVYKQVSVVFKSPRYIEPDIDEPVSVRVQLRRLSDGEASDPFPFLIIPAEAYARKSVKRKRPSDILISKQIQAEAAKNAELLGLANLKAQNNDASEPWELPVVKNKSVNSVDPSKPFIPVITIRNNELNAARSQALRPATLANGSQYNNDVQSVPFDYSMKSAASQKAQNAVYQPLNSISKSQQYQNSSDTLNSDSWIKDLIDTIDPKTSSQPTSSDASKETNIAPEPTTKFIPVEQTVTQNTFVNIQEIDILLEAEGQTNQNISEVAPISGSLSGLNISDLIKDIGNGIAGTSTDNIVNGPNFDNLPPLMEGDDASNANQPIDLPIEALKSPYLLT